MAWLEDGVEEFKKMPPAGKAAAVGAVALIVGVAWYEHQKNAASTGTTLAASTGTSGGSSSGGQSPFSSIPTANGSVPLLPTGTNPVYDPNGGLIGFQPTPPAQTPPASNGFLALVRDRNSQGATSSYDAKNPGGIPLRASPGGAQMGLLGYGSTLNIVGGPVKGGSNFGSRGGGSDLWYQLAGGGYVSQYDVNLKTPPATPPAGPLRPLNSGSGPSTSSLMENPMLYHQNGIPHLTSAGH